jgi:catalase
MPNEILTEVVDALDALAGGIHPGFRPVHARGVMIARTFTPTPAAAALTGPRTPTGHRPP